MPCKGNYNRMLLPWLAGEIMVLLICKEGLLVVDLGVSRVLHYFH